MLAGRADSTAKPMDGRKMKFPFYMIREDPFHPHHPRSILLLSGEKNLQK
jgi:hypothetical protein